MKEFSWRMPSEVVCGAGCVDSLARRCAGWGERPLLVTGRNSARLSGALGRVLAQFPDAAVFDAVEENPSTETCEAGAEVCRQAGCDWVIGVGGGSPMDAAKAIAVLARNPVPCEQYFGRDQFTNGNLPIAAIPTTAGTGSEVTPYAVITHRRDLSKKTVAGASLFPRLALLDPELSVSMPRSVTVHSGMDALSQAMEGMLSRQSTPMGDALAIETCRIVRQWLPLAAAEPANIAARTQMLYAAMLSGCIIAQSGTTLVHAMGYYFTLRYGLDHGLANALLLTPLFRYNADFMPEKVSALAAALGCPCAPEPEAAKSAITHALGGLAHELGLSLAGRDAGVEEDALRGFADHIVTDRGRFKNQPGAPLLEDVYRFFVEAWQGNQV